MDDHRDPSPQATIEFGYGEPDSFTISNVHDDSPPLMAQSSDPRPALRASDRREAFGNAEPSDILGLTTTPVRSFIDLPVKYNIPFRAGLAGYACPPEDSVDNASFEQRSCSLYLAHGSRDCSNLFPETP